ncbi:unnamed protein product [Rotaria sordida]|uniref:Uncharacterized protein n=1 Tax=Rotaria sordida TaxID=392033 RepID=A0A815NLB9_9BILA|nr:unnamed protein product [Rotaria sordida]CAF1439730.1 unnamed protein product [Rotaria sordida]CAF1439770.1 unnamed protein product [Rotaria sordida]CAF1439815.1 unnamed protein product [Rotaria sordida]CAF1439868.1 unnamed protein product [Rotaria sordida]
MANKSSSTSTTASSTDNNQLIDTSDNEENKESTTLLWFDPNIGSRQDTELTKQKLRLINDYVIFHTDLDQTLQLLPRISSLRQVDSIFIFCMKKEKYEHLTNEYSKIIGIYVTLGELCKSIEEQIDLFDKQLQTFSYFDQYQKSTKDLSKQSAEFLWFQLFNHVITRLPRN